MVLKASVRDSVLMFPQGSGVDSLSLYPANSEHDSLYVEIVYFKIRSMTAFLHN